MNLRTHWEALKPREQRTIALATLALIVALLWAFVWHPLTREVARLTESVAEQSATLAWMEQAAAEVKRQKSAPQARSAAPKQSLLVLVDTSAKAQGLGQALKQVQPEGETVRVRLEQVAFDSLLRWLDQMAGRQAVRVTGLTVEPGKAPGQVDARVTLAGKQP